MPHFALYTLSVRAHCWCSAQSPVAWVSAARSRFRTPESFNASAAPHLLLMSRSSLRAASVLTPGWALPWGRDAEERRSMSSEQNKAIVRRLLEEPWKGNTGVIDELVDRKYVGYDPSIPEPLRG